MIVAGHAGHHGPLVRHGGAAEVYNRLVSTRELLSGMAGIKTLTSKTHRKKLVLQFKSGELLKIKAVYILR